MKAFIKPDDRAPSFSVEDIWGNNVTFPDTDKCFYLSFHRFAACPFCNLQTNELIKAYPQFTARHTEIVSIWPSDKKNLLKYAGDQKAPFPIVSDVKKELYQAFGVTHSSKIGAIKVLQDPGLVFKAIRNKPASVEVDADPYLMPASFLINAQGKIIMAHYGKHIGDHPAIETIFSILNK